MFESLTHASLARMKHLEAIDLRDRTDGTPHSRRLRQITPAVGRLLAILAASSPAGPIVEIGASAGYSTLWLACAARSTARRLITYDFDAGKIALARETFSLSGVSDIVELIHGDALIELPRLDSIAFCFLDAEKDLYQPCYDLVIPRLPSGGILVADNVLSHASALQDFVDFAQSDPRLDTALIPADSNGQLICRKK